MKASVDVVPADVSGILWSQVWDIERAGLVDRTEFVRGDFFAPETLPKADPAGQDIFVLRAVLHDWADAEAQRILINLRTAIGGTAAAERDAVEGVVAKPGFCMNLFRSAMLQCLWVCLMATLIHAQEDGDILQLE